MFNMKVIPKICFYNIYDVYRMEIIYYKIESTLQVVLIDKIFDIVIIFYKYLAEEIFSISAMKYGTLLNDH